jgi:predicted RNase H-like HicB family nuclease
VLIEQDEDGKFVASCPSLEGCHAQGDTFEEVMDNIRDVVAMCLKELEEEGRVVDLKYPEIIGVKRLDLAV